MLSVWAAWSCSREPEDADGGRALSLAVCLKNVVPGQGVPTKMSAEITQSGGNFRGIEQVVIIPFKTDNKEVASQDSRLGEQNVKLGNSSIGTSGLVANNNSHFFGSASVPNGMNRVLTYGHAPDPGPSASKENKHTYGVLTSEGLANPLESDDISFHLEPILSTGDTGELSEVISLADALLDKLNVIMSLMSGSQQPSIVSISDAVKRENNILACCYYTMDQIRTEIQTALLRITMTPAIMSDISLIISALNDFSDLLDTQCSSFPSAYGIPDGAIGFLWNGKSFIRLINGVNIALVDPSNYCYPPSLWYYANSPVRTSTNFFVKDQYVPENQNWRSILECYTDGGSVNSYTQSVAIVEPLQYGIGLMELSLVAPGAEAASLVNGCPLTGIIVGDQKDVDFRFLPAQGLGRYIYDNIAEGLKIGSTGTSVHTLVLQTEDNKPVHFALEFQNTTGNTLHCLQGDILPWCKFYFAGQLDPGDATQPSGETLSSVFTRDRRTTVTVRVESLRKAYNTVPDLHDPQLEIGVVAEMKWTQLTPESIKLLF